MGENSYERLREAAQEAISEGSDVPSSWDTHEVEYLYGPPRAQADSDDLMEDEAEDEDEDVELQDAPKPKTQLQKLRDKGKPRAGKKRKKIILIDAPMQCVYGPPEWFK